jgi:hypothetical protein
MNELTQEPTFAMNLAIHLETVAGRIAVSTFLGLVWGTSLRAWMVLLALQGGEQPHFTWSGTFGGILLPAALMGAIFGGASHAETWAHMKWWTMLSPLLLIVGPLIFTKNFIPTLLTTGLGSGAIGVALIGLLGGYALSPFGTQWTRWLCGLFILLHLVAASVYGIYVATVKGSSSEAFSVLLFVLLMVLLIAGVSAPYRYWSSNVLRHANATLCFIRLKMLNDVTLPTLTAFATPVLELEITDNGCGLTNTKRNGLGLSSMCERATEVGGTCQIETLARGRTRVLVHLPCPAL